MFKAGWLEIKEIDGVEVVRDPIPQSRGRVSLWRKVDLKYITVHNDASRAKDLTNYIDEVENRYVSFHFSVGEKIYQELPIIYNGWHCGDGTGKDSGNMTSIGVEICTKGDYELNKLNGMKLIRWLMDNHLKGKDWKKTILPHKHWNGKECPRRILAEPGGFDKFVEDCMNTDGEWLEILKKVSPDYWKIWEKFFRQHHRTGKLNLNLNGLLENTFKHQRELIIKDLELLLKIWRR